MSLHAEIMPPMPGRMSPSISSISLHFLDITALTDGADGPTLQALDVTLDSPVDAMLGTLSPGWYSGLGLHLGNLNEFGFKIDCRWHNKPLTIEAAGGKVAVVCPTPVLATTRPVALTLVSNPNRWFDAVNLDSAIDDGDDSGLTISRDDNPALAAHIVSNVIASFSVRCGD